MQQPSAHFDFFTARQELSTNNGGDPLAGDAVAYGETWNLGWIGEGTGAAAPAYIRAFASADVEGTLTIEQSPDGVNWWTTDGSSDNVAADFTAGTTIEGLITLQYARAILTNGGSDQTEVEFDTALVSR